MDVLNYLLFYALLTFSSYYFMFEFGSGYVKNLPVDLQRIAIKATWWQKLAVSAILALPTSVMILLYLSNNLYFHLRILILKLKMYRLKTFILLFDKHLWLRRALYKRRIMYFIFRVILGKYNIDYILSQKAGLIVAGLLLEALAQLTPKNDNDENTDSIPDTGATE